MSDELTTDVLDPEFANPRECLHHFEPNPNNCLCGKCGNSGMHSLHTSFPTPKGQVS